MLSFIKSFLKKRRIKSQMRKKILSENLSNKDTAVNITKSITQSHKLYKELITKTHPDLFEQKDQVFATKLSSKITKNKKNYSELIKLKKEVETFLETKQ